ncbi:MAG: DUF4258 domain-containing protein [Fibrobacter sp.]|nr:DUF4258 domain-containing protein [Fibrobacter sp.]
MKQLGLFFLQTKIIKQVACKVPEKFVYKGGSKQNIGVLTKAIRKGILYMNIKFSEHAKQRMHERGITEEQMIHFFVTNEGLLGLKLSDKDESILLADALIDGKKYRLVYNAVEDILVTVFPLK